MTLTLSSVNGNHLVVSYRTKHLYGIGSFDLKRHSHTTAFASVPFVTSLSMVSKWLAKIGRVSETNISERHINVLLFDMFWFSYQEWLVHTHVIRNRRKKPTWICSSHIDSLIIDSSSSSENDTFSDHASSIPLVFLK